MAEDWQDYLYPEPLVPVITERTLGIPTIGQAPRDNIAALFYQQAPASTNECR